MRTQECSKSIRSILVDLVNFSLKMATFGLFWNFSKHQITLGTICCTSQFSLLLLRYALIWFHK